MDALPSGVWSSPLQNESNDDAVVRVCNLIGSLEKQLQEMSSSKCEIHDTREMYEEKEKFLLSEVSRYAADYQRLAEERIMYEEKEEYLLSEISHMVSGKPSSESEMARHKEEEDQLKTKVSILERCFTETQELLHQALEDRTKSEKSTTQFKEMLEKQVALFSRCCYKYEQDIYQLNAKMHCLEQNYQDVVCESDALRDHLDTLLNNSNGNSSQEEKINSLVEENEELEERLSYVIEQKLSIQTCVDKYIASMEEEKTKLINECSKYEECNDRLKVEYGGVTRGITALQADLEKNKESVSTEFAELKRHSEELVKQMVEEKKGEEMMDGNKDIEALGFYMLLVFACLISIILGSAVMKLIS